MSANYRLLNDLLRAIGTSTLSEEEKVRLAGEAAALFGEDGARSGHEVVSGAGNRPLCGERTMAESEHAAGVAEGYVRGRLYAFVKATTEGGAQKPTTQMLDEFIDFYMAAQRDYADLQELLDEKTASANDHKREFDKAVSLLNDVDEAVPESLEAIFEHSPVLANALRAIRVWNRQELPF